MERQQVSIYKSTKEEGFLAWSLDVTKQVPFETAIREAKEKTKDNKGVIYDIVFDNNMVTFKHGRETLFSKIRNTINKQAEKMEVILEPMMTSFQEKIKRTLPFLINSSKD